jgi:hypothetical protein
MNLIINADIAMYYAKKGRCNLVTPYQPNMVAVQALKLQFKEIVEHLFKG